MSGPREFSHITLTCTPFKKRMDESAKKSDLDIEKDVNIAYKCADRFNYNTNLHKKVPLSDRFEVVTMGFEVRAKQMSPSDETDFSETDIYIYRKDKKQDNLASPLPAGMNQQNPLPAGRGFLSPSNNFSVSTTGILKASPQKSLPASAVRPPKAVFDDIPTDFV